MDRLTFTAELIKALAWPLTILVSAYVLRKPFSALLPLIHKLKYQDIEVEFDKQLVAIKEQAAANLPQPKDKTSQVDLRERLLKVVGVSPEIAVIEAWRQLENQLHEYRQRVGIDVAPAVLTMPLVLASMLQKDNKLTQAQYQTLTGLKHLRDKL